MKRKNLWAGLLAIGLAFTLSPVLLAGTQSQKPNAQGERYQQKSQTFVGKVVRARNGQYALLTDKQTGKGFYLDDQEKAKAFDGQTVKVTGTLDVANNLIHITDIQPA